MKVLFNGVEFEREDGVRLGIGRRYNAVVVPNDLFLDLDLQSVATAVAEAYEREGDKAYREWWLSNHPEDHQEKWPTGIREDVHFRFQSDGAVELIIGTDLDRSRDGPEWIRELVAPALDRFGAQWIGDETESDDEFEEDVVVAGVRTTLAGRSAADLVRFGEGLAHLIAAARGGELSLASLARLVRTGYLDTLIGLREGRWFDAKRQAYPLGELKGKLELAKDVAAFANADGGLILIGASTAEDRNGEVVAELGRMPLELVSVEQMQAVIQDRVFPAIEGLDVRAVEHQPGSERGVVMAHIPPQGHGRQPFLVRGVEEAGRHRAVYLAIPIRRGDRTQWADISNVHATLVAGRVAFASLGTDDTGTGSTHRQ